MIATLLAAPELVPPDGSQRDPKIIWSPKSPSRQVHALCISEPYDEIFNVQVKNYPRILAGGYSIGGVDWR
jgi:hypothetical protein